jgi:hypothetical protein
MNATDSTQPMDGKDPWDAAGRIDDRESVAGTPAMDADRLRPGRAQRMSRGVRAAAMVVGGLVAGGVLAGAVAASAATDDTGSSAAGPSAAGSSAAGSSAAGSSATGTSGGASAAAPGYGTAGRAPGGGGQGRSDETVVTGTKADTLRAAAVKAVPGGTVDRIETDAGDAAYEVHMTKSDGTKVTVKFDDDLALVRVEDGMGLGDPTPPGADSSGSGSSGSASGSSSTTPTPST